MITDTVWQYIYKYYISGIVNDASYNPVDTITYAILLGLSVFGILKLLEKLDIEIDSRFIAAVTPYILAGSSLRVLEDLNIFTPPLRYLFITPIIYFSMFAVTVILLTLAVTLERKGKIKSYHAFFGLMGVVWTVINIAVLLSAGEIENPVPAAVILILGAVSTYIAYLISRTLNFTLLTDKLNISILFTHLLDASSTFIGMDWLGYYEKHVVPTFFINLAGNFVDSPSLVMYPLKLLVFIPVLYMLDHQFDNDKEKKLINLMKLAILVLGLSPAVRNTLRLLMGV
ncbi:putative membrane protein [Candidatus Methanoperedens nitroreducens]|uniref:Putative membrane protein n=1 Tax=Candidatus Methanoperedens nitratireducens TaxID=1392998 RepID=A0A062VD69_9EURY|nr:DUF63 family protein [Candidatus Methanoperedens nitroreducens]KCZ73609.1 putative membrane protein [Candidatus Methanoperedens nitroreducens]MDJ1422429.1 DUF63 family protein [Candidatus Methanoperedens sp.]